MARERGYRTPYRFSLETKNQVLIEQQQKCAITGREDNLQCHHILPIAVALGFWPNIDPEILKHRDNAVYVNREVHELIHEQMHEWPREFFKAVVIGMYSHLREISQNVYAMAAD